jgi:hypothetical protein
MIPDSPHGRDTSETIPIRKSIPALIQKARQAVDTDDWRAGRDIADDLAFGYGMTYQQTATMLEIRAGIDPDEWEFLMQAVDHYESAGA